MPFQRESMRASPCMRMIGDQWSRFALVISSKFLLFRDNNVFRLIFYTYHFYIFMFARIIYIYIAREDFFFNLHAHSKAKYLEFDIDDTELRILGSIEISRFREYSSLQNWKARPESEYKRREEGKEEEEEEEARHNARSRQNEYSTKHDLTWWFSRSRGASQSRERPGKRNRSGSGRAPTGGQRPVGPVESLAALLFVCLFPSSFWSFLSPSGSRYGSTYRAGGEPHCVSVRGL